MAEEVRINLTSSADTSGIDKMGAAVGGVSETAGKAATGLAGSAKASKELSQELGKTVAVGSATKEFLGAVRDVGKGGADALFAMGRAAISFGNIAKTTLVTSGPIGWAIAALGALAAAVIVLKDSFTPATESVGDFKKRIEELDKANLRALDATLSALSDRLKNAKEEADAVRASLDKIDDAEMAAQLAAVKKADLTAAQKDEQELLIRDEFKKRREGRQRDALTETASGARETRDTLAPEFEDARQKYGDLLNQADAYRTLERERDRLQREISGFSKDGRSNFDYEKANRIQQIERNLLPGKDDRGRFDAELASARDRFQGADGKGGIAAQYQAALKESEKAERALARFNDELQKIGEWDRARVRIERGGIDPRDTEAAARQSPGRNRLVGADGRVVEYESSTVPTINQQLAATADAARRGLPIPGMPASPAPSPAQPSANQVTFGPLAPSAVGAGNQLTRGPLQPGSDNTQGAVTEALKGTTEATEQADTGDETAKQAEALKAAAEKHADAVKQSAEKTDTAMATAGKALAAASGALSQHNAKLGQHDAEFRRVWGAISALRSRAD